MRSYKVGANDEVLDSTLLESVLMRSYKVGANDET